MKTLSLNRDEILTIRTSLTWAYLHGNLKKNDLLETKELILKLANFEISNFEIKNVLYKLEPINLDE